MRITLRQLLHAQALLRHGNFRRAADALELTQPALTRSIQMLESSLGVTLFDRLPMGVQPTRAGESLLGCADEILRRVGDMEHEASLLAGLRAGSIRLAMGAYPAHELVPRAIAACLGVAEGFSSQIIDGDWHDAVRNVLELRADIAVADITTIEGDDRLAVTVLDPAPLSLVCRPGHPLAGRRDLDMAELCGFPLAGSMVVPRAGRLFEGFPRAGAVDPQSGIFHPAVEVKTVEAAIRVVMHSDAITGAQLCSVEQHLASGSLHVLHVPGNPLQLRIGLIRLRNRLLSPMAGLFVKSMLAVWRQMMARDAQLRREHLGRMPGAPLRTPATREPRRRR